MSDYAARNHEAPHTIAKDDPLALRVLKDEHHRFRDLFQQAKDVEGARLKKIADELCLRLAVHMTIEEEILYPAAKTIGDADKVDEGIVEHAAGKDLIAEIEQLTGEEELYAAKVHVLGEQTIHHIDEEDEELFAEMKEAHQAGKIDLDAVGEQLRARQAELYREVEQQGEIGKTEEAQYEEITSA